MKHTVVFMQQSPEHEAGAWQCSGCGLLWELSDCGRPSEHRMNYCPQCGGLIAAENFWEEEESIPAALPDIREKFFKTFVKQFFNNIGKALDKKMNRAGG